MKSFVQEDTVRGGLNFGSVFRLLGPYFLKRWWLFAGLVFLLALLVITGRMGPQIFGWALDQVVQQKQPDKLVIFVLALAGFEVLRLLSQFLHGYFFKVLGNRVLMELRQDLVQFLLKLPTAYFDKNPSGRIVTRLTSDVAAVGDIFTEGLFSVFISLLEVLAIVTFMFIIAPNLALATLAALPVMLIGAFWLSQQVQRVLRDSRKINAQMNAFVTERLSGMSVLQSLNLQGLTLSRFSGESQSYYETQMQSVRFYAALWPLVNLFYAVTLVVSFYGATEWNLGLSVGSILAFTLHVQDIFPPIRNILERYQQFQAAITGAERVEQILTEPQEPDDVQNALPTSAPQTGRSPQEIEFRDVWFRYSEELPWVLKGLNLRIPAGSSCALIGATGSGKSTAIGLLQKMYFEYRGQILLGPHDIRQVPNETLRRQLVAVNQDNFLFRSSVRNNLTLFDSTKDSDQRLWACLDQVGARNLVERLGGLESIIEERGGNLSVGERQLLSLARVLVFDPPILVLDEATSNMDSESERLVQVAIERTLKDRTCLVIAHRLATIRECGQIAVLRDGVVAELGSHQELLKFDGAYAEAIKELQG